VPVGFLSDAERERLDSFPAQVVPGDIETHFTLSRADRRQVPRTGSPANRLGFALQLGTLRFLGFCPDDLGTAPVAVVAFMARQLDVAPAELARYGRRGQARTEHLRLIRRHLGFRKATAGDLTRLETWLADRALEHDRPTLLLRLACEHLFGLRVERPGLTHLERLIAAARQRAQQETYRRLSPVLTRECRARLDSLLSVDAATGRSTLAWLQQSVASYTPPTIVVTLEKRACCRQWGVDRWDVSSLSLNRLKFLAQIARRSTNQALQRMPERRRYPILIAFLYQTLVDLTDEAIDLFDRCLAEADHRASRDLEDFRLSVARSTNEKLRLFREIGRVVLDSKVKDADLRRAIYRRIPAAELRDAVTESVRIIRPLDDHDFDFLESRYTYLRQFTPEFIEALAFRSAGDSPLLRAVGPLRQLSAEGRRVLPDETPLEFVPTRWRPYVNKFSPDPEGPWFGPDWYSAAHYCNWLSEQEGLPKDQWCYLRNEAGAYAEGMSIPAGVLERTGYRLPTEAEWEYACRAGAVTSRSYGHSIDLLDAYARYQANSKEHAWACGSLFSNDLGLFDMLGNEYEWCQDSYNAPKPGKKGLYNNIIEIYESISEKDRRLLRVGSFTNQPAIVRSAFRLGNAPASRFTNYGFRSARTYN
jgi:Domain of unknown function (DUF4158)/Sulfatase-modifying factor enzyme 1